MKNLTYRPDVKKTPAITRTVDCLDRFFEGEPSIVTSGLRTPIDQMTIILQKIARHKIEDEFWEFRKFLGSSVEQTVHIEEINRDLYWWQRTWSRLLGKYSDIVNPPVPAEMMEDYIRPGDTRNKKGEIIQLSPHQRGLAFDIGGEEKLLDKAKCVMKAQQSGECFIKSFLIERVNNCVHCDAVQIG